VTLPLLKPALSVALILPHAAGTARVRRHLHHDRRWSWQFNREPVLPETTNTFIINTDFGVGGAMSIILVLLALAVSFVIVPGVPPRRPSLKGVSA